MWIRPVLACVMVLHAVFGSLAQGTVKRGIWGVSTGMTLAQAWAGAARAGGTCVPASGRSSASPAFSCVFNRSTLVVGKSNYSDPARVTRFTFSFLPSKLGKDLPAVLKEAFDVGHDVAPDGHELTSWRSLKSGESVKASCDTGMLPGNVPSSGGCRIEVSDDRLMAADRAEGAKRHWLPVPFSLH